jgi:hypothetical protein
VFFLCVKMNVSGRAQIPGVMLFRQDDFFISAKKKADLSIRFNLKCVLTFGLFRLNGGQGDSINNIVY